MECQETGLEKKGHPEELPFKLKPKKQQRSAWGRAKGQPFQTDRTMCAKALGQ
jgi:hypothetical protein